MNTKNIVIYLKEHKNFEIMFGIGSYKETLEMVSVSQK
jgi:hypothetical protein